MPIDDNKLIFKNNQNYFVVPIVAYTDCESILKPVNTCFSNPEKVLL